jgi:hypothetical protein
MSAAFKLHPGDERIGADASIPLTRKGKRMYEVGTFMSQVNLPLNRPTLVASPARRGPTIEEQALSSDQHIWRTYSKTVKGSGQEALSRKAQEGVRHGIRQRVAGLEKQAHALRAAQEEDRLKLLRTQQERRNMEWCASKRRCATRGPEAVQKPKLRTPEPGPTVSDEEVLRVLEAQRNAEEHRRRKRMEGEDLRPFGPPIGSKTPTFERWDNKAML